MTTQDYTAVEFSPMFRANQLIGFCLEEPKEVLRRVFKECIISEYRGISCPIDSEAQNERLEPSGWGGLVIDYAKVSPPGTMIIGPIEDLDFSMAKISLAHQKYIRNELPKKGYREQKYTYIPPTQQRYKEKLKGILERRLHPDVSKIYFQTSEDRIEFETAMQEVAEVTLGITGISFEELGKFLLR